MGLPKCFIFKGFYDIVKGQSGATSNPTYKTFVENQNEITGALAKCILWQPETTYALNQEIISDSMDPSYKAVVTSAGETGETEPIWPTTGSVTDGAVQFVMMKRSVASIMSDNIATETEAEAGTDAIKRITPATLKGVLAKALAPLASILSPAFTGIPTAPTATVGTNSPQIATTAFIANAMAAAVIQGDISMSGTSGTTVTHNLGKLSYAVDVVAIADTAGDMGDIYITKAVNAFTVFNTGGYRGTARYKINS